MRLRSAYLLICVLGAWLTPAQAEQAIIEHELSVKISPQDHQLWVSDQITLPTHFPRKQVFTLHRAFEPQSPDQGVKINRLVSNEQTIWRQFEVELPEGVNTFTLEYAGQIYHPLEGYGKEQARGYRNTPGLITEQGVYLAASSHWYPQFTAPARLRFILNTQLPKGWRGVSQGERVQISINDGGVSSSWHSPTPQEEIYFIAAPFTEYSLQAGDLTAQVFLRGPDESLANTYLQATLQYLQMYEKLLGPYPYRKFALVENFWETGFGMPSFTLLGSRVIRLPFIINSSYPHEILHNWWGNGVYVDFDSGNWSEGLTAYLADHLIKEQQGQGVAYRQQGLQKYSDYAAKGRDFALSQFRGRHSSASEAVGYGKTLMFFHMLRQQLGEQTFITALRQFYRQHRFNQASFNDLKNSFERVSDKPLTEFFEQWVNRTGAPALALVDSQAEACGKGFCLSFTLQQTQDEAAYQLQIPVAITLEGEPQAQQSIVNMTQKQQTFTFSLPTNPARIDIDPEFDVFRKLSLAETPPAFSQLFGSQRMLVILPSKANPEMKAAWQVLADDLGKMGPGQVRTLWDIDLDTLPENQAVTVLGWENLHANSMFTALAEFGTSVQTDELSIGGQIVPRANHSIALTVRHHTQQGSVRAFIASDLAVALAGLSRKLPHYHKYSYLAFAGEAPEIQLKGRWPVTRSPLSAAFTSNAPRGELRRRDAMISSAE